MAWCSRSGSLYGSANCAPVTGLAAINGGRCLGPVGVTVATVSSIGGAPRGARSQFQAQIKTAAAIRSTAVWNNPIEISKCEAR
jgi:hypothetical protein